MNQPGEPSVEEILDSIKKVIARDSGEAVGIDRRRKPAATATPEPADAEEAEEVLELEADFAVEDMVAQGDHDDMDDEDALTRGDTREAMRQNFAALAMLSQPGKQPQIVRSGETSLEGLVREMLRPMLREWLDANLPGMVEEMVKAEIARIAGKRS
ncbi:DUF2497 domain-containing protein [Qipengyuania sp. XHP0207]|uniref:DUF2497 domain-containing protein n=1 Tax=Qipengyuania sp. XHP0207 TaxID=3038078 RepID=UPI00241DCA74|nr:DUF2497 domain-containing protein [Qipengyuania sp. XHP0207]MDG5748061.1 DUF2497 domain-containing protein [Qipengyuania sp. XHP0207]